MFSRYAAVIPDLGIDKTLDYGIPEALLDQVKRGVRVSIPVRGMTRTGYVLHVKETSSFSSVKPLSGIISCTTPMTEDLFSLVLWMAHYYCAPIGEVFKTVLPASLRGKAKENEQRFVMRGKTIEELRLLCIDLRRSAPAQAAVLEVMLTATKGMLLTELLEKAQVTRAPVEALKKKGALLLDIVRVDRSPLTGEDYFPTKPKPLNPEQAAAFTPISESILQQQFSVHLLHGVTGSGKTEVYLQAIEKALSLNQGVIMLVPEISLTPQTIERFRGRFHGLIAVLHHRLSHGERFDEWNRLFRGEAKIVIGARSAIFSPLPAVGLIIVDEEHEGSYKQTESAPAYHARDIAVMRGKLNHCPVILGSATPSIESYHNALTGKYVRHVLKGRADAASLPKVQLIDMKTEYEKAGGYTSLGSALLHGIQDRLDKGEQALLFLNRRGYHTQLLCTDCRASVQCPHCEVALAFHKNEELLLCHLCGFSLAPPPKRCQKCGSNASMKFRGVGTEQVEKTLHALLPGVRTLRMDADTTRHKGSHQRLLREFGTGKADVLIGTQMIAKGLHFPGVTLVGVLNSDSALNIPDFRSAETSFQLITQVAGRAGRGHRAGEVIIQTLMPDNLTMRLAAQNDYEGFIQTELESREILQYPPFCQIVKLLFTGPELSLLQEVAERFHASVKSRLPSAFDVHPVLPPGHPKIKDQYRLQFLIRGPKSLDLSRVLSEVERDFKLPGKVRLLMDVNPLSTYF